MYILPSLRTWNIFLGGVWSTPTFVPFQFQIGWPSAGWMVDVLGFRYVLLAVVLLPFWRSGPAHGAPPRCEPPSRMCAPRVPGVGSAQAELGNRAAGI